MTGRDCDHARRLTPVNPRSSLRMDRHRETIRPTIDRRCSYTHDRSGRSPCPQRTGGGTSPCRHCSVEGGNSIVGDLRDRLSHTASARLGQDRRKRRRRIHLRYRSASRRRPDLRSPCWRQTRTRRPRAVRVRAAERCARVRSLLFDERTVSPRVRPSRANRAECARRGSPCHRSP